MSSPGPPSDRQPPSETQGKPRRRGGIFILFASVVVLFTALFLLGYLPRTTRAKELSQDEEEERRAVPEVPVVSPKQAESNAIMVLPGSIEPITEAPIYARASGYLKRRMVDIGDRVRAGQLLVVIESPESEQQVEEAKATLAAARDTLRQAEAAQVQAEANRNLARVNRDRWERLAQRGVASRLEFDERHATFQTRDADVNATAASVGAARNQIAAAEASLRRLQDIYAFTRVTAPFTGLVTARNVDVGALISSGNGSAELFRMAQTDRLRIFVEVPQADVASVRPGTPAVVRVSELAGREFQAQVTRSAASLNTSSRTLRTEVQVPNRDGILLPGMYAQVTFSFARANPPLLVPSTALLVGREGTRIGVVEGGNTVRLRKVEVGRDYGREMEVLSGLHSGDLVITVPSDAVQDGMRVSPQKGQRGGGGQNPQQQNSQQNNSQQKNSQQKESQGKNPQDQGQKAR